MISSSGSRIGSGAALASHAGSGLKMRPNCAGFLLPAYRAPREEVSLAMRHATACRPAAGGLMTAFFRLALALLLASTATAFAQTNLRIGLAEDPDVLDPSLARTYVGRIVFASLCDKLF